MQEKLSLSFFVLESYLSKIILVNLVITLHAQDFILLYSLLCVD